MPSQLKASAYNSFGFKQDSFKPVKLPISGTRKEALLAFTEANSSLANFKQRKLALQVTLDHVVYRQDAQFLVEYFGQPKGSRGRSQALPLHLPCNWQGH